MASISLEPSQQQQENKWSTSVIVEAKFAAQNQTGKEYWLQIPHQRPTTSSSSSSSNTHINTNTNTSGILGGGGSSSFSTLPGKQVRPSQTQVYTHMHEQMQRSPPKSTWDAIQQQGARPPSEHSSALSSDTSNNKNRNRNRRSRIRGGGAEKVKERETDGI
jgi:hypothetical protein